MLEPLIDTVVICSMIALVIVISARLIMDASTVQFLLDDGHIATTDNDSGVALTSAAFGSLISGFRYLLVVADILFAFSTIISWSDYGMKAWTYLFGDSKKSELTFKIIFCIFIVTGAAASLGPVIDFCDATSFAMAVVNIFALYFLMKLVKQELISYGSRLASGEIKPYKT